MPTICVARAKGERIRYHTRLLVCKNVYDPSGQQKKEKKNNTHTDRRNSGQKVKLKSSAQMML